MKKRLTKIFLFLLVFLTVVFVLVTALLQSEWFKNRLKEKLLFEANRALHGHVEAGSLTGGIFAAWKAHDLSLAVGPDTLATIESAVIRIDLFRLLDRTVTLRSIELERPCIHLDQSADGRWNVNRLFSAAGSADTAATGWRTELKEIQLHHGSVHIDRLPGAGVMPSDINDIDLRFSAQFFHEFSMGRLSQCRFVTSNPEITVRDLVGTFLVRRDSVWINDLSLLTQHSSLSGQLCFPADTTTHYRFWINADSLDDGELRAFLHDWPVQHRLWAQVDGLADADSIHWQMEVRRATQVLSSHGRFLWRQSANRLRLESSFEHIYSKTWLDDLPVAIELNGRLQLSGWAFSADSSRWQIDAQLHDWRIADQNIQQSRISATCHNKLWQAIIQGQGNWGAVEARGDLQQGRLPQYHADISTRGLNLQQLTGVDSLESDLSVNLAVSGRGLQQSDAEIQFTLQALPSRIAGHTIDRMQAAGYLHQGTVVLDSLLITSPTGHLFSTGTRQSSGWLDLIYHGDLHDSAFLHRWLPEELQVAGNFYGRLTGHPDSLETVGGVTLQQSRYGSWTTEALQANWHLQNPLHHPFGQAEVRLRGIHTGSLRADSANVRLQIKGADQTLAARIFFPDSVTARSLLHLHVLDSSLQCIVANAELGLGNQRWTGGGDSSIVRISPQGVSFKSLSLACNDQQISLDGILPKTGDTDLSLVLKNFDVHSWGLLYSDRWPLNGKVNWHNHIGGSTAAPVIESAMCLKAGRFGPFAFDSLSMQIGYRDEKSLWRLQLHNGREIPLSFTASLPVHFSLEEPGPRVPADQPVVADLTIDNLPVQLFSALLRDIDLGGKLSGRITVNSTLQKFNPAGTLRIADGRVENPVLGKPLRDVTAEFQLDSTRLSLSRLTLKGGDGIISGSGYLEYSRSDWKSPVKNYMLQLQADHFTPIDSREMSMTFEGGLSVERTPKAPRLSGKLLVSRSRFDLTAIAAQPSTMFLADQPLLVVTQQDTLTQAFDASVLTPAWLRMLEPVRGSVKLEIPRNTWLRSREMNLEIAGELDLVKEGRPFELFGSISIMRGSYDLYSRRFEIQSGTLTFVGGEEFNPNLDLQAEHVFRGVDQQKRTLALNVSGQLFKPVLRFTLDGLEIAETDAVSYLIFGRSFDQLTQGEKTDLAQNQSQTPVSSDAMKQLLAGQIAGQLSNSLRNQLNLDVIEFRGDQNWRQATIVVGKYITNDLFISYSREFNFNRSNEVVPEQVTLEYEVLRSLHLQATKGDEKTTGLDVIWKWEK